MLIDVPCLIAVYYYLVPDPLVPEQCVAFDTSGHRGCAFRAGFDMRHIRATSQAICAYRKEQQSSGLLLLGMGTQASSALTTNLAYPLN